MAHELTSTDHMVSAGNVTPWHGLGTVLPGTLTATEALEAARLNWQVAQEPIYDADMAQIPGFVVNRRSDNKAPLGVVPSTWTPVQNDRLIEIAEALAQVDGTEFRPVVETAGSLRGGRIVWALVKTGERSFADSVHHTYLLLSNGHDGTRALKGTLTDTRVVCANTLRFAEASTSQLFVTHAKGVEQRLATALETLGWANETTRATFAIYEALAAAKITADAAANGFARVIAADAGAMTDRDRAVRDEMMAIYRVGSGNCGTTAFDFLNAVTDWVDHSRPFREAGNVAERRFLFAAMGGEGDRMKGSAFRQAKCLAGV